MRLSFFIHVFMFFMHRLTAISSGMPSFNRPIALLSIWKITTHNSTQTLCPLSQSHRAIQPEAES
ncbi:hypothetical protein XF_1263 [Xylella fastidiosa 9a5c]|uniref:Uncharacterized protein n=1 Tax=Xylella fastidiosa (strain 9a5c) TaxID=160492 RepID=Q9PDW6_XYLFA|nr:hypothetical protein XF_1263 [Xylella fastidiosa 9a5c]